MQHIIGVDVGTTHVKAVVINLQGRVLLQEQVPVASRQPYPGYHEQDPDLILRSVAHLLARTLASVPFRQVLCISFSAAMHSLFPVDSNGKALTPAITWADTRSIAQATALNSSGKAASLHRHTGTPVHPMSPLCKIKWLKEEATGIFNQASRFVSIKEYLFYHFFGEWVIDYSLASATGLFDIQRLQWYEPALQEAGIDAGRLSVPVSPTMTFTSLTPAFQRFFNVRPTVPFVIGASDGCLAHLGAGALKPGEWSVTIGTSGALRKREQRLQQADDQALFHYRLDEENYITGGAVNSGGIVVDWFSRHFADHTLPEKERISLLLREAAAIAPGSEGLICLPYFLGERSPVWDAAATGLFAGIRLLHTRGHFMRALLEGICFSLCQVLEHMEQGTTAGRLYASGGFTRSDFWLQLLANICGRELRVPDGTDASATGAVWMGMKAMQHISDWNELARFTDGRKEKVIIPELQAHEEYKEIFERYKQLYQPAEV